MKKLILTLSLSLACGSIAAQEAINENSEQNLNKEKKYLSCPVSKVINGKQVLIQPVKVTPISVEGQDEDRQFFKVEAQCGETDENEGDEEEEENEDDEEDEKEEPEEPADPEDTDTSVVFEEIDEFIDGEIFGNLFRFSRPTPASDDGAQLDEDDSDSEENKDSDWVIRRYMGFGYDYPLLFALPMGAYIEDPETTNGFVVQFSPGWDGFKVGAGVSTGFYEKSTFRTSLMLVAGLDGTVNEVNGRSAWEEPHNASTYAGLAFMLTKTNDKDSNHPPYLLSLGYGAYIDGDQADGENFEDNDLFLFQLGLYW